VDLEAADDHHSDGEVFTFQVDALKKALLDDGLDDIVPDHGKKRLRSGPASNLLPHRARPWV